MEFILAAFPVCSTQHDKSTNKQADLPQKLSSWGTIEQDQLPGTHQQQLHSSNSNSTK